jgi:hypothetical protein
VTDAETTSHSFLIRLWIEGVGEGACSMRWRGHVTHLIDEERRYVETFEQIERFLLSYLRQSSGAEPGSRGSGSLPETDEERPGSADRPI